MTHSRAGSKVAYSGLTDQIPTGVTGGLIGVTDVTPRFHTAATRDRGLLLRETCRECRRCGVAERGVRALGVVVFDPARAEVAGLIQALVYTENSKKSPPAWLADLMLCN